MIVYQILGRNKLGLESSAMVPLSYVQEMELMMNLTGNLCWAMLLKPAEYLSLSLTEKDNLRILDATYGRK